MAVSPDIGGPLVTVPSILPPLTPAPLADRWCRGHRWRRRCLQAIRKSLRYPSCWCPVQLVFSMRCRRRTGHCPNCSARRHSRGRTECCLRLGFRRPAPALACPPLRPTLDGRSRSRSGSPSCACTAGLRSRPRHHLRPLHLGRHASTPSSSGTRGLRLALSWTSRSPFASRRTRQVAPLRS